MLPHPSTYAAYFLGFCLLVAVAPLAAQDDCDGGCGDDAPRGLPGQPALPRDLPAADVSGRVVDVEPRQGLIALADDQNHSYVARIDPEHTTFVVKGTADVAFLRPGLWIRFQAALDAKGVAAEPLSQITVFTPRGAFSVGIAADGPDKDTGQLTIAGQIRSLKKGKLTLETDKQVVSARVAEDAQVAIEVADLSLALPGSEIHVTGRFLKEDAILADVVEVTLQEPLSAGGKKRRSRGKPKAPATTPSSRTPK